MTYYSWLVSIVYVVAATGNAGEAGLQTDGVPAIALGAMAVASADSNYAVQLFIIAPDGRKIFYDPGIVFGRWTSSINLTIVVNG